MYDIFNLIFNCVCQNYTVPLDFYIFYTFTSNFTFCLNSDPYDNLIVTSYLGTLLITWVLWQIISKPYFLVMHPSHANPIWLIENLLWLCSYIRRLLFKLVCGSSWYLFLCLAHARSSSVLLAYVVGLLSVITRSDHGSSQVEFFIKLKLSSILIGFHISDASLVYNWVNWVHTEQGWVQ